MEEAFLFFFFPPREKNMSFIILIQQMCIMKRTNVLLIWLYYSNMVILYFKSYGMSHLFSQEVKLNNFMDIDFQHCSIANAKIQTKHLVWELYITMKLAFDAPYQLYSE